MIEQPLDALQPFLTQSTQLCLLPVSHTAPCMPVMVSEQAILYPARSVKPAAINIVSYPAHEWAEVERRLQAVGSEGLSFSGSAKAWLASAITGVTLKDFFSRPLLAFPVRLDWDAFLSPKCYLTHLKMMDEAIQQGKAHLEGMAPSRQRLYLPRVKHAKFGTVPRSEFSAMLFYTPHDNESYIVGGRIEDWRDHKASEKLQA